MNAKVNDRFSYDLDIPDELSVRRLGENRYTIVDRGKSLEIEVLETDFRNGFAKLAMDGFVFRVLLEDELATTIRLIRQKSSVQSGIHEVTAPIPGVIKSINLDGNGIDTGETLLVLEAMKMENAIQAPMAASEVKFQVNPGDRVVKGQVLCTLVQ